MVANSRKNQTRKPGRIWIAYVTVSVFILALIVVLQWGQGDSVNGKDEPGILRNLTTMVGAEAPAFSLKDSDGRTHTITAGDGRNHVLIFHMGSI